MLDSDILLSYDLTLVLIKYDKTFWTLVFPCIFMVVWFGFTSFEGAIIPLIYIISLAFEVSIDHNNLFWNQYFNVWRHSPLNPHPIPTYWLGTLETLV